jgi:hypothetical protein
MTHIFAKGIEVEVINGEPPTYHEPAMHYTDGMQPFDVRHLTGDHAPTGPETFRASQPPPWNGSGRWDYTGPISPWSGGAYDPTTMRVLFSGGGHSDGANNGWHFYDFGGAERPGGFGTLPGSRSDAEALNGIVSYWRVGAYLDGKPNAVHTYSNVAYSPKRRCAYRGNSSSWPNVHNGQTPLAPEGHYWFDEAAGAYGSYPMDISDTGGLQILSPDESMIFADRPGSGTVGGILDLDTGAFTPIKGGIYSGSFDPSYAYDSKRDRYLLVGQNLPDLPRVFLLSINWAAKTKVHTRITVASHAATLSAAMGIVYDEQHDCYWAIGGRASGSLITHITRIDAATLEAEALPLNGSIPKQCVGQYGRVGWLSQHRAIGVVAHAAQPAAVVKLP